MLPQSMVRCPIFPSVLRSYVVTGVRSQWDQSGDHDCESMAADDRQQGLVGRYANRSPVRSFDHDQNHGFLLVLETVSAAAQSRHAVKPIDGYSCMSLSVPTGYLYEHRNAGVPEYAGPALSFPIVNP